MERIAQVNLRYNIASWAKSNGFLHVFYGFPGEFYGFPGGFYGFLCGFYGFLGSQVRLMFYGFLGSQVGLMFYGFQGWFYGFPSWFYGFLHSMSNSMGLDEWQASAAIIEACGSRPISLVP